MGSRLFSSSSRQNDGNGVAQMDCSGRQSLSAQKMNKGPWNKKLVVLAFHLEEEGARN
jgi:hypothetical protein